MTRDGLVTLDSLRLVANAGQIACFVCGDTNTNEAELCNRCQAPMALAHQVREQKVQPQLIAVLGASGVGKTVYLGMLLDMLSRRVDNLQVLARGAFSISLQQCAVSALSRCCFPNKTPSEPDRWNWVHCQVRAPSRKRPVELILPDLAGEALFEEVDHPGTFPVIRSFLRSCAGVVVLIDSTQAGTGNRSQDYHAMKLLSYLSELDPHPKNGWARRPVAFAFSKADQCEECFDNADRYAERHLTGLWKQCREKFRTFKFFASGVVGACAYREGYEGRVRVPLRIEPRGIVEPFEWLVEQLPR